MLYTATKGRLAGMILEKISEINRPYGGPLWLMETGSGRRYWLRAENVTHAAT
jgi:hypothetical protein